MRSVDHWLCVMDVKNRQEDYAYITQLIDDLEQLETGTETQSIKHQDIFSFRIMRAPDQNELSEKHIAGIEDVLKENYSKRVSRIENWEQLYNGLKKGGNQNRFSYYIRVDLSGKESELPILRYLVLLFQLIPSIHQKTKVFLYAGCVSSAEENALYFRASHFLRFIQSQYPCFVAMYGGKLIPLTKNQSGVQQTFVPLLEINSNTYNALTRMWFLESDFQAGQKYSELHWALRPAGAGSDTYTINLFQIGTRFLFQSLNGHKYNNNKKKYDLLEKLTKIVKEVGGITPLDMLLFGSLIGEDMHNGIDDDKVRQYLSEIKSFSRDVAQILENICNHSEHHKGVFTMRLQTTPEYIEKNYPGYQISHEEYGFELLIADANRRDGILRNFLNSNKATPILRTNENRLSLADFFEEEPKDDEMGLWRQARTERPGLCLGLLSFSKAVRSFDGAFYVRSSPSFAGSDRQNYYYQVSEDFNDPEAIHGYTAWLPGTQFSAIFKRVAFRKKLGKQERVVSPSVLDVSHIVYATTYRDLARTLRFQPEPQSLFTLGETVNTLSKQFLKECEETQGQEKKDSVVNRWSTWFDSQAKKFFPLSNPEEEKQDTEQEIEYFWLYIDFEGFGCEQENFSQELETFCKGFLSSIFFRKSERRFREHRRFIFVLTDVSPNLGIAFYQTLSVLFQRIDTSSTGVYFYQAIESNQAVPYFAAPLQETMHRLDPSLPSKVEGFPNMFPYLLLMRHRTGESFFEYEMSQQASVSISAADSQGYKIENTHMRLGNKVHLDSFFEMALFFENPNYAYYTAFLILYRLKSTAAFGKKFRKAKQILFYGYSSYSRSIIWAAMQIWREYLQQEGEGEIPEIEFAIYQNDLKLESDQSHVQMYFSQKGWQKNPEQIWKAEETTLIQIVPISSSLTTFNKMLSELSRETGRDFQPLANLTAFWVRDDYQHKLSEEDQKRKPTEEEKEFWTETDPDNKWIKSEKLGITAHYIVNVTSFWRNPLVCEKCFPRNSVLEFPLVETDPTSTVPTQQFYLKSVDQKTEEQCETENDERVAQIRDNLLYGHISRGHNHFQYYLQTRRYFQQERRQIAEWLKKLPKSTERKGEGQHIDVLVIPKQTSNVEFSQFVYEYYFKGEAESIIVNTEKEFRSNFLAEYNGLGLRLRSEQKNGCKIQLHYIDTAIDSGVAFHRSEALIRTLFEQQKMDDVSTSPFLFENIFLLISRMSYASKQSYVQDPKRQFHAYVELHISNMRSFGDSCVPCKLQQEARRYYQNAATKQISAYWEEKSLQRNSVPFDSPDLRKKDFNEGYRRMACAHRAAYYFRKAYGKEVSDYFEALRSFFTELLDAAERQSNVSPVYQQLQSGRETLLKWLSAGLKVLVRPFFSFDYKLRCAVMDFYLLLSEYFIQSDGGNLKAEQFEESKPYLMNEDALKWVESFAEKLKKILGENAQNGLNSSYYRLCFIQAHLLKGLTDLKSNYILRYSTICAIFRQISAAKLSSAEKEDFLQHYLRSVLRVVNNSSDETKSVWLEHLLQVGYEYPQTTPVSQQLRTLSDEVPPDVHPLLQRFMELLLVENNRPLFQGVRDLAREVKNKADILPETVLEKYHMRNVCRFINLGNKRRSPEYNDGVKSELIPLLELYQMLERPGSSKSNDNSGSKDSPLTRYDNLQKVLQEIALGKAEPDSSAQVLLLGPQSLKSQFPKPLSYYMISPQPPMDYKEQEKADIKLKQLAERMESLAEELDKDGFCLIQSTRDAKKYDVFLKLDNNYDALEEKSNSDKNEPFDNEMEVFNSNGRSRQKIEPMYIFLPCNADRISALMVVRKILMFRCWLVTWLEQDFNNHAISVLMQQRYWAETLAADKVGDHAEQDFIECLRRVLSEDCHGSELVVTSADEDGMGTNLYREDTWGILPKGPSENELNDLKNWYLMRAYVNSRISRLYRTHALEASHFGNPLSSIEVVKQMKRFYAKDFQPEGKEAAYSLRNIFF